MGICTTDDKRRDKEQKIIESNQGYHLSGIKPGLKKGEKPSVERPSNVESINDPGQSRNIIQDPNITGNLNEIPEKPDGDISKNLINGIEVTREPIENKNGIINQKESDNRINYNNSIFKSQEKSQVKALNNETNNNIYQPNAGNDKSDRKSDIQDNTNLNNENFSINYEEADINKDYYLICPTCKLYITNVESVEYDSDSSDFKFKYKCFCNEVKEDYLRFIIKEEKPICNNHNDEIKFLCQDCSTQICEQCKNDNHNIHNIKYIISYEAIPEQIMNSISEKEDTFKGFSLFKKIFNFYKNSPIITKLPDYNLEENGKNLNENKLRNTNVKNSEINPELGNNGEEEVNNLEKNLNNLLDNKSEKKENDMNQNNSEKESQKNPENNDVLNNIIIPENNNIPEEQMNNSRKNNESNVQKSYIKSDEKDNNIIGVNLNNPGNENNNNDNLNNPNEINNIDNLNNPNENNNNDYLNNPGNENNNNDILNNVENEINNNDNLNNPGNENNNNDILNNVENEINNNNGEVDFNNLGQMPNIDNSQINNEKPEVIEPNNFINNQDLGRIDNENIRISNKRPPEELEININSQNEEINPFKNNLNEPKPEENSSNVNPLNNINNDLNNDRESVKKNDINDNMNDGINNNMNDNFQIINNDFGNKNTDSNINKVGNDESNINVDENKNSDVNSNLNDINNREDLEGKKINNSNANDNKISWDIKPNNSNVLKQYINTKTLIGHEDRIVSLIMLSSGYIATGSYDMTVKIWDITKDEKEALIGQKCSVGFMLCLLELNPNELLAGNSENCIDVFNLEDLKSIDPEYRLFGHSLWISALVKCDEDHFASASNDAKIFIWDSHKKNKMKELLGHTDCILTMILLENGNLCSGSADNTIRLWDWKNEKCLSYFKAHNNWVKSIYQFNSQILLSGSDDRKIKIWNTNLDLLGELKGHKHSVRTFCKIDDNYFASGSFDNTIKIWDFNEQKCVYTLEGHISNVICIINYNNKLISCSNDKTIKIWEEI